MSSTIAFLEQYFNKTDINHYGKGRMGLSIRATAKLVKKDNADLGRSLGIYADAAKMNLKLDEMLTNAEFPLLLRLEWGF